MTIMMTVNQLRRALEPLFGLCPIEVEILPCPLAPPRDGWRPGHHDRADIVSLQLCNRSGIVTLQVQRPHDC